MDWLFDGAVYYALGAFEGRPAIKIGCTTQAPRVRVGNLGCRARLLACEPGDGRHEMATHRRFDADRIYHEWYRPSIPLLTHIANVGMQLDPTKRAGKSLAERESIHIEIQTVEIVPIVGAV